MEGNLRSSLSSIENVEHSCSQMVHHDGVFPTEHETSTVNDHRRKGVDRGIEILPMPPAPRHRLSSGIGPYEVEYRMDHERRGKILIFNHKTYDNVQLYEERFGTDLDKKSIQSTFENLGFQADPCDDLTLQELQSKAIAVAEEDHSNRSCLVVVVMTHGEDGGFLMAKDKLYNIEVLLSCFFANKCPSLVGKPKIFIIQACRGDLVSEPCRVFYDTKLASTTRFYTIPAEADLLLVFSTYAGRKSHREAIQGSWFIQELCKELGQNANKLDMMSMLTNVTRHIAIEKEYLSKKQVPVTQSTLMRKLFLCPPIQSRMIRHEAMIYPQDTVKHDSVNIKSYTMQKELATEIVNIKKPELPEEDVVVKLENGLKLFLNQRLNILTQEAWDSGKEIVLWMSRWHILDKELQSHTYYKLVKYLQSYARDWECYNLLYIPRY